MKVLEEAEAKAKKIIAEARAARSATMKQCAETVDKAVKDFRAAQEAEYNAYANDQVIIIIIFNILMFLLFLD